MKWFFLSDSCILPFPSQTAAYQFALQHHLPIAHLKETKLQALTPKSCLQWLNQVIHLCESGHSLQSALMLQKSDCFDATSRNQVLAIKSMLAQGDSLTNAITVFLPNSVKSLASNIPLEGTEESRLAAVCVVRDLLTNQITLSQTLCSSLNYPASMVQAALLLGLLNAYLTHSLSLYIMLCWALVTVVTAMLYGWIYAGFAFPFLCRHIASFRTQNTLVMMLALLKSGEPLQRALLTLSTGSHPQDTLQLQRCLLMLRSGASANDALPRHWFLHTARLELDQLESSGDICSPLEKSAHAWQDRNETILKRLSKAFPILGIVVAAVFVTQTLISLYAPLMDVNTLGF